MTGESNGMFNPRSDRQRRLAYSRLFAVDVGTIRKWEEHGLLRFPHLDDVASEELAVLAICIALSRLGFRGPKLSPLAEKMTLALKGASERDLRAFMLFTTNHREKVYVGVGEAAPARLLEPGDYVLDLTEIEEQFRAVITAENRDEEIIRLRKELLKKVAA